MIESVNYQVRHYLEDESVGSAFFWCDVVFLLFYSVEAALKFGLYGLYYFYGEGCRGNLFDFFLLLCNCWSVASTVIFSSSPALKNFTWLRLLRILRALRMLRVLRLAAHFRCLQAILFSLADSFWTLLWSVLMLALIYFVFALVFVSRVATYFNAQGSHLDPLEFENLVANYGGVSTAMESLVLVSTGGRDWGDDFVLLEPTGTLNQCFFLFFIFFITVAVMNIILGIFVQDAMKNLQPDESEKARELAMEEQKLESRLRELVSRADVDGSGKLKYNEWAQMLKEGKLRRLFGTLGFPAHQLNQFFLMMCSADESSNDVVDIDYFVKGCIAMKGAASSFDMNAVLFEIQTMRGQMLKEMEQIRELAVSPRRQAPAPDPHAASRPAGAHRPALATRNAL